MRRKESAKMLLILWVFLSVCSSILLAADAELLTERTRIVSAEVAALRMLPFKHPVATRVQSPEHFKEYVLNEIKEQYGPDKGAGLIRALVRFGALEQAVDLEELYTKLLQSQAAAYYDPREEVYNLLTPDADQAMLDYITSHELVHALQHQYFNLFDLLLKEPERWRDNMDAATALSCLVEGDATVVMNLWLLRSMRADLPPVAQLMPVLQLGLQYQATLDYQTMMKWAKASGESMPGMGSFSQALEDLDEFPRYIVESMLSTYIHGAVMVADVWQQGGWDAVNALYTNPPASSEQVLYPEKLIPPRDEPVDIRRDDFFMSLDKNWRRVSSSVIGQLGAGILFALWQDAEMRDEVWARATVTDWGGDRYYLYENAANGEELLVWFTVWDDEEAAADFAAGLKKVLDFRFPGYRELAENGAFTVYSSGTAAKDTRFLMLHHEGNAVTWYDAANAEVLNVFAANQP